MVAGADLAILPGSRSTVADLAWLRERGLADALTGPGPEERSRARDLRRLPDAGGADRRRRGIPRRPGAGPRSAAGLDHLRGPQGARTSGRHAGRVTSSTRTRSTMASPSTCHRATRAVPGRVPARIGLGHDVARRLRERRLPARLAHHDRRGRALGLATRSRRTRIRRPTGDHDQHLGRRGRVAPRSGDDQVDDGSRQVTLGHRHRQRQSRPPDRRSREGDERRRPVPGRRQGCAKHDLAELRRRALPRGDRP